MIILLITAIFIILFIFLKPEHKKINIKKTPEYVMYQNNICDLTPLISTKTHGVLRTKNIAIKDGSLKGIVTREYYPQKLNRCNKNYYGIIFRDMEYDDPDCKNAPKLKSYKYLDYYHPL